MEKYDACTPYITLLCKKTFDEFRRNIIKGADQSSLVFFMFLNSNCSTEVYQFYFKILVSLNGRILQKHKILKFKVSMYNTAIIKVIQSREKLFHNNSYFLLIDFVSILWKIFMNTASLTKLSYYIVNTLKQEYIIKFDNVWMIEFFQQINLSNETHFWCVIHHLFFESFNSPHFSCSFLDSTKNMTKSSFSDFFFKLIEIKDIFSTNFNKTTYLNLNVFIF